MGTIAIARNEYHMLGSFIKQWKSDKALSMKDQEMIINGEPAIRK